MCTDGLVGNLRLWTVISNVSRIGFPITRTDREKQEFSQYGIFFYILSSRNDNLEMYIFPAAGGKEHTQQLVYNL